MNDNTIKNLTAIRDRIQLINYGDNIIPGLEINKIKSDIIDLIEILIEEKS